VAGHALASLKSIAVHQIAPPLEQQRIDAVRFTPHLLAAVVALPRRSNLPTKAPKSTGTAAKKSQRVIKKYPNRRLYDTDTSTYITLAEVKQLVLDGHPMVVRDAKTNEDLTRSILLQIILEEESGGVPMFSEVALTNIIRFYGHAMQGFMGSFLEKNVQAFTDMQTKMAEQGKAFAPGLSAGLPNLPGMPAMMGAYAEQSQTMFAQMQEQMQKQTEQMFAAFGVKR
jgi:polyhydroxyalkanoate synthesis repressor PhaR